MKTVFGGVYVLSTAPELFCGSFTSSVTPVSSSRVREHLVALCGRVDVLPGADQQVFVEIDPLSRPVDGDAKQGASDGHSKIDRQAGAAQGTPPLVATISTPGAAPVIACTRLRAGRAAR